MACFDTMQILKIISKFKVMYYFLLPKLTLLEESISFDWIESMFQKIISLRKQYFC